MNENCSITANFALDQYYLTIYSTEGGSVTPLGEGTFGPFTSGETVNLVASEEPDYHFTSWTGDTGAITNPNAPSTTITVNENCSITANFALDQYYLTIYSTEGGSVTSPGEGTFGPYIPAETVNLVASAEPNYHFTGWTGETGTIANPNNPSTTVTMNENSSISAHFEENNPPTKPTIPSGPSLGDINISYFYSTSATDPDGDNIYYWFDWGDGTNSSWIGPYSSGTSGSASKVWNTPNIYNVKAKAKDLRGAESPWSDSISICINGSWEADTTDPCKERKMICDGGYVYRNMSDGTICDCTANNTLKRCYNGTCSDTEICNSSICNADDPCDGKTPGEECGHNSLCNSTCECQGTSKPPIANFRYSPEHPLLTQTITFNASASYDPDGVITTYEWDFGDETNGTGKVTTHAYSSVGSYNVTLTITDDDGATNSTNAVIQVTSHDTTPPASITNLQSISGPTWINWTWTNPQDADFNHTMLYVNSMFITNVSAGYYNHSGLHDETWYNLTAYTVDTSGNVNTTEVNDSAKTLDTTMPTITGVTAASITTNSATITWRTDEPANSVVEYGTTIVYGSTKSDATMVTEHAVSLTGLSSGTTYHYRVKSTDAANNLAVSDDFAFTTESKGSSGGGGGGPPIDSDGDGYMDPVERLMGYDPYDPCDPDPDCEACLALKSTPAATPKTRGLTSTPTPTVTPTVPPPAATPEPATPEETGFEAIFVISGLLAVAYFVLRRKRS